MAHAKTALDLLKSKVSDLPNQPGVYLFRGAAGELLYVGKASRLRSRVRSYFRRIETLSPRVARMVRRIADVEVRRLRTETEALLLEAQLIKEKRPYYNVSLRDDKSYPLLKVTNEAFPRLLVTRRKLNDGAVYFGPYTDAGLMHDAVRFMRRVFPMRTCRTLPKTTCLEHHLGQCLAPCAGLINPGGYRRIVQDLIALLGGERNHLIRDLTMRMERASRAQRFEEAARIRDQVQSLSSVIAARKKSLVAGPLEQMRLALRLPKVPRRIEAVDISNIGGEFAVGSVVVFKEGEPLKAQYRRLRIKTLQRIDDYEMMREVVRRRYSASLSQSMPVPDLLVVDGGKGQLNAAMEAIKDSSVDIPVIGLAKRFDHIITPWSPEPIALLADSKVLQLVQHLRDEAHRFAIAYHRRLRAKSSGVSEIEKLPGIGPARRRRILRAFGSMERMKAASVDALAKAAGISHEHAHRLTTASGESG